ncbi:hypothetical protein ACH5RR_032998 [Cinchona calisaya]|uniref:PPM-type phosphatase domain-containing protein n=1 Tax=Cinchona calisaya TaxID=153742 RepID=A0ABD2YL18_9GENT
MGFLDLHLKLKSFRLRRFLKGDGGEEKRKINGRRVSWMMPEVSHGYHIVDQEWSFCDAQRGLELEPDKVVIQREQIEENELWFFGVFDARIGDGINKYIQAHFFDKKFKESYTRKCKETLRKAHLNVRAKMREVDKAEEACRLSSATAIVINGEKLVVASMGEHKAVLCRNGKAYQINRAQQEGVRRHWSRKFIPGVIRRAKVRLVGRNYGNARVTKPFKSSELVVGSERIDSDTEFVILASIGIWEVMKHQEAVNLISHIEDPQEAAECLANEALTRMSKHIISCLIIRFD